MKTRPILLLLAATVAFLPRSSRAQSTKQTSLEGTAVETEETELVRKTAELLKTDADARSRLIERIRNSSLATHMVVSEDPKTALSDSNGWILEHPQDAAQLAVGFARDDHDGTHAFEQSLYTRVERYFELNPKRYKGILGTLTAAGQESKRITDPQKIPEEEQRELLKNIFEGTGGQSAKVLSDSKDLGKSSGSRPSSGGPATFAGNGLYDRLSSLNPTGYSPNVLAYQSALNAERASGAPHLIETGRLDYSTLLHPFFPLRHDVDQLSLQLRRHRTWELAKMAGIRKTMRPEDYDNPALIRDLEAAAKNKTLPPGFEHRQDDLDQAVKALNSLRALAEKAKNPSKITTALLRSISDKQKEAARWITAASLEADLQQLEEHNDFYSEELKSVIGAIRVSNETRQAYLGQGDKLKSRLLQIEGFDRDALTCLQSPGYLDCWSRAQQSVQAAASLRKNISRDIMLYTSIPSRLLASTPPLPTWKERIKEMLRKLIGRPPRPASPEYARALAAFEKIASGNFDDTSI